MSIRIPAVLLSIALVVACGSDSTGPEGGGGGGGGSGMTFTVDGGTVHPTSVSVVQDGEGVGVLSSTPGTSQGVTLYWKGSGTGTFLVESDLDTFMAYSNGGLSWSANGDGGSGSVTVTSSTGSRIKGTFNFVGVSNGDVRTTKAITGGSFDVTY